MFKVSVIIPLYNAEKYIARALESCLALSEVEEIIVVDDGHKDNARNIVEEYGQKYSKIKIFQHPNRENRGAGASRNLGLKMATQEYIAFLDADDFYLPNRFKKDREIFEQNSKADGCYNALGVHFYSEEAKRIFEKHFKNKTITTVSSEMNPTPDNLFKGLLGMTKGYGYFSLDGLTIKKEVLKNLNVWFFESSMHEDTIFNIKLAFYFKIYPSQILEPVARRGVHEENRITTNFESEEVIRFKNRHKQWLSLWNWAQEEKERMNRNAFKFIKNRYDFYRLAKNDNPSPKLLLKEIIKTPSLIKNKRFSYLYRYYMQSLNKVVYYCLYAFCVLCRKIMIT